MAGPGFGKDPGREELFGGGEGGGGGGRIMSDFSRNLLNNPEYAYTLAQQAMAEKGARREAAQVQSYLDQVRARETVAQQQLHQGLTAGQHMIGGQAGAGGTNPFLQHQAVMAGGQMGIQGQRQAGALEAAELQAARGMQMEQLRRQAEYHQFSEGQIGDRYNMSLEQDAAEAARQSAEREARNKRNMQIIGTVAGAGASGFSATNSDVRMKRNPFLER